MNTVATAAPSLPQRRTPIRPRAGLRPAPLGAARRAVVWSSALAWLVMIGAEATGVARYFHHDVVFEGGLAPSAGVGVFLFGWLVMVAAMMLPATVAALGPVDEGADEARRGAVAAFLGGFVVVWALAGLGALGFDMAVHRVVEAVPAVEARPWLVAAGVLAVAGGLQLLPSTRRASGLTGGPAVGLAAGPWTAFSAGQDHGRRCLRADGPLMLVMFAVAGSLVWMAALTVVMVAARSARLASLAITGAGVSLLAAAGAVVLFAR